MWKYGKYMEFQSCQKDNIVFQISPQQKLDSLWNLKLTVIKGTYLSKMNLTNSTIWEDTWNIKVYTQYKREYPIFESVYPIHTMNKFKIKFLLVYIETVYLSINQNLAACIGFSWRKLLSFNLFKGEERSESSKKWWPEDRCTRNKWPCNIFPGELSPIKRHSRYINKC